MSLLSAKIDLNVTPTQNAISGAISGVMARFATAPLDVIKIRSDCPLGHSLQFDVLKLLFTADNLVE
ncbi:hypothetical protein BSLG_005986 [Batrachochytrium salamandrivorans]|nr:hypothetical protein BSLG_005986 [Batrachochytrium salamandrivorans]